MSLKRLIPILLVVVLALGIALAAILAAGIRSGDRKQSSNTSPKKQEQEIELPVMSNMASKESLAEVSSALSDAGLSNVDMFTEWVQDFNKSAGKEAGLVGQWAAPGSKETDIYACMDGWTSNHKYPDADCRITVYTLLQDVLSCETPKDYYSGTYMMFDIEAIENAEPYSHLRDSLPAFNTLFGEGSLPYDSEPEEFLNVRWTNYGFSMNTEDASFISVLIEDETTGQYFVGHTGILIPQSYGLLFVEKLAFQQPYQATKVADMDQLLDLLSQRGEYFGEEGAEGPMVFQNDQFIDRLTRQ